jgi:hypothetical protein
MIPTMIGFLLVLPVLRGLNDMAFAYDEFKNQIESTLTKINLNSPSAVNLLLGTAAVESKFGEYEHQIHGPALGPFQMEPATFNYLVGLFGKEFPTIVGRKAEEMMKDLELAIIMCRLKYRSIKLPLPPDPNNVLSLGIYWKNFYNSPKGAGTVKKFTDAYKEFCHGS